MSKRNTFIIPVIRGDFLQECISTLYKYTPNNFYVLVVDNTPDGIDQSIYKGLVHLWLTPYRNLGFSKSHNMGIVLSQTSYITLLNDDVIFIDNRWWQGIEDTFATDEKIVAVNPNSPKEGAWGYGLTNDNKDTWVPREGFIFDGEKSVTPIIHGLNINNPELARLHYDDLLNMHPIWQKDTLCDALAMWCTTFTREGLKKVGLLDERFYPAGGEDYCMMCEIYSIGLRAVGTTKSWVWHHWGKSKDDISEKNPTNPIFSRPRWNANEEIWGDEFDVWGHVNLPDGTRKPLKRILPKLVDDL